MKTINIHLSTRELQVEYVKGYNLIFKEAYSPSLKKNERLAIETFKKAYEQYKRPSSKKDMVKLVDSIMKNIKGFCVVCGTDLQIPSSDRWLSCPIVECKDKFDEMEVEELCKYVRKYRKDAELSLQFAVSAIKSTNGINIFDPFPSYFLKGDAKGRTRGELKNLYNNSYNEQKDFQAVKKIANRWNVKSLINDIYQARNDESLYTSPNDSSRSKYTYTEYKLFRFIILSNKSTLKLDKIIQHPQISLYHVINPVDTDEKFSGEYLFHGSNASNWYSIMRNGLKVASGTSAQRNGAAYGKGIYLSDKFSLSASYSNRSTSLTDSGLNIAGVYEVRNAKAKYHKGSSVYVVPNEKDVRLRYLLMFSKHSPADLNDAVNEKFGTMIKQEKQDFSRATNSKSQKRLMAEYKMLNSEGGMFQTNDIKCELVNDNIYDWKLYLSKFDKDFDGNDIPLTLDMKKYNVKNIVLEVIFPQGYPFEPPFIRVVSPQFEYRTGHITLGGSICMEALTTGGWSPKPLENVIMEIISLFYEGGARIKPNGHNKSYSLEEAKQAFKRTALTYNWTP
uniref:UBC core domain-containing protein n=1 Tax=viral metagenome TaxID=1070528 RepID=A0A6C0CLM8_9ZZZZ